MEPTTHIQPVGTAIASQPVHRAVTDRATARLADPREHSVFRRMVWRRRVAASLACRSVE